jgi:hypothetical protein
MPSHFGLQGHAAWHLPPQPSAPPQATPSHFGLQDGEPGALSDLNFQFVPTPQRIIVTISAIASTTTTNIFLEIMFFYYCQHL